MRVSEGQKHRVTVTHSHKGCNHEACAYTTGAAAIRMFYLMWVTVQISMDSWHGGTTWRLLASLLKFETRQGRFESFASAQGMSWKRAHELDPSLRDNALCTGLIACQ